jgi:hypothetical protein
MQLVGEALFVGTYCLAIFAFLKQIAQPAGALFWFALGFIKHFLGYVAGLHTYYCQYGSACCGMKGGVAKADSRYLLLDSIVEGLAFIFIGYLITKTGYRYAAIFVAGALIHLLAELLQVHKFFCQHRCLPARN